jgi:hypothetical protein
VSGWSAEAAYGWRIGTLPAAITHTQLLEVISE